MQHKPSEVVYKIPELSLVIQAGGQSQRMGRSKASIPFLGHPLIFQPLKRLYPLAEEVIITTNEPANIKQLFEQSEFKSIRYEPDLRRERGALSGLFTALSVATKPYVALCACDMIFASPELFLYEYKLMEQGNFDLVVPFDSNGFEPFHAIYKRETCLFFVEQALEQGEQKMSSWFEKANMCKVDKDDILKINPQGGAFLNINTPDQLVHIEKRIAHGDLSSR